MTPSGAGAPASGAASPSAASPDAALSDQLASSGGSPPKAPAVGSDDVSTGSSPGPTSQRVVPLHEQELCDDDSEVCRGIRTSDILIASREFSRAEAELQKARALDPKRVEALIALGRLLSRNDSLSYGAGGEGARKALEFLDAAATIQPLDPLVRLERGRFLLSLGRAEDARPILEKLAGELPKEPEVQAALGIARLASGDAAASLGPLERARDLDPHTVERHLVLGTVELLLGHVERAERSFRAAIAIDPSSAAAHGDLGSALLVRGEVRDGRAHLERAVVLAPRSATYLSNLAYADLLDGKPEEAEKRARQAIRLDEKLASAWLNLGLSLARRQDRKGARAAFEKARQLDPTDPRARDNLADLDALERP